jgi:hypothetical protein
MGRLANLVLPTGNPILLDHQFLAFRQLFLMALNGQSDCQHVTAGDRMTAVFACSTNHVGHVGPAALIGPDRMAMRGIAPTTTRWAPAVTILQTTILETRGTPPVQLVMAAAIAIVVHLVVTLVQTEDRRSETLNVAIGLFVVSQRVPIESCAIRAADTGSGNIPNVCSGIIVDQSGNTIEPKVLGKVTIVVRVAIHIHLRLEEGNDVGVIRDGYGTEEDGGAQASVKEGVLFGLEPKVQELGLTKLEHI